MMVEQQVWDDKHWEEPRSSKHGGFVGCHPVLLNLHGFGFQLVDEIRKMDNVPANAEESSVRREETRLKHVGRA